MTTEEVTKSISAAYDSVNLINEIKAILVANRTVEQSASLIRNVEHLKVMMAKDWFSGGLTAPQTTEINALII